jgi:predicted outer membrane protein
MENTLVEKVQAILTGASVYKKHWEKRQFLKDKGAKRDYIGFTCAVLVRVKKDMLQSAIDQVRAEMMSKTTNPELKSNVKNALNKAEDDFNKMRGL